MIGKDLGTVAVLVFMSGVSSSRARAQAVVEWELGFEKGLEIAHASDKSVLLDFSADWCSPCRLMEKTIWMDPELVAVLRESMVPVRIDFDSEKKLARRFRVSAIPTMIWADPWGNELGRNLGFTDVPTLLSVIESLPEDFQPVASFQELVSRNPEHARALLNIASIYREEGYLVAADSFYERALEASKKGKTEPQVAEQAYVGLGLNMLARRHAVEARKLFEKATKLPAGPHRAVALYDLVAAHAQLGEERKAGERLEELRLAYPDDEKLAAAEALVSKLKKP